MIGNAKRSCTVKAKERGKLAVSEERFSLTSLANADQFLVSTQARREIKTEIVTR